MSTVIVESTVIRPPQSPKGETPKSPPSSSSKRPHSPPTPEEQTQEDDLSTAAKRRRVSTDKERGKRMFGALMGTLSSFQKQSLNSKTVGKRAEIDARVKERVQKEKEEMEANREKEERERRQKEEEGKERNERETVRLRNEMKLNWACHLVTETMPRIYWRPYILTQEQKDKIDQQIEQARAEVDANEQGTMLNARQNDSPDEPLDKEEEKNGAAESNGDGGTQSPISVKGNGVGHD